MSDATIHDQLQRIADDEDFPWESAQLVDAWQASGVGPEAVEPILRFMEAHPDVDYGQPSALTLFLERFCGRGYEEKLLESMERRPTPETIWLLNALVNGAGSDAERQRFVAALTRARSNDDADPDILENLDDMLERIRSLGWSS